jgi:hypothetical protein
VEVSKSGAGAPFASRLLARTQQRVEVLVEQSRIGLEQPGNLLMDSGDLLVVSCGGGGGGE